MQHDFVASPVAQDYGSILGAPFRVLLANGFSVNIDQKSGKSVTEIIDLPGLIAASVQSRVLHPRKLSGEDLKYIRSALCMRSHEVAEALDLSPEHYSRCESGTKTLSSSAEKFYRMYVFLSAASKDEGFQDYLSQPKADRSKDRSPEQAQEAKEAVSAFKKVFLQMKIEHLYPAGEKIEFIFSRCARPDECPDCGGDEGKWQSKPERDAA